MREITTHQANECNEGITIEAHGVEQPGGASAIYVLAWQNKNGGGERHQLFFQRGPWPEYGNNGVTNEALLAILVDRLEGFQGSPFACDDKAAALAHLQAALQALHKRTRERVSRGVEGTLQK